MTDAAPVTVRADVAEFARRVRAHLDDLPADDIDDLVDGLEADLMDQAADAGDTFALPDAEAYASELRSAAGLAPRASGRGGSRLAARWDSVNRAWAQWSAHPVVDPVRQWLVSLRPVGWVLRGWLVFTVAGALLGTDGWLEGYPVNTAGWLALAGLIVVSVQWGRGLWMPYRWMRRVVAAVTVVSIVAVPFVLVALERSISNQREYYSFQLARESYQTPGLAVDGERVRNIFAYDAEGNPIEGVQLFDHNGNPLQTVGWSDGEGGVDEYYNCGGGPVPVAVSVPGRNPLWNVYPLREVPATYDCVEPHDWDRADALIPGFPFASVPSVSVTGIATEALTESADPSPAPEPSAAAQPSLDPSPVAEPTD